MRSFMLFILLLISSELWSQPVNFEGHSHNDYAHEKPLFDALEIGLTSIEIDIFLINGKIIVGHDEEDLKESDDLESMYLVPIKKLISKRGDLFGDRDQKQVQLLIDLKMGGLEILDTLHALLDNYSKLFQTSGLSKKWYPLKVILSGDKVRYDVIDKLDYPYFFVDGRCSDIKKKIDTKKMPIISDKYTKYFKWTGEGKLRKCEVKKLRRIVKKVHKQNKKLRFWATPDNKNLWSHLVENGVDFINVDDLELFSNFKDEG